MSGIQMALLGMSFAPAVPTVIGEPFGGGFYAGQISTTANSVPTHYLIIAPKSSGLNGSVQWKTSNTSTGGTTSDINGPTNSANMNNASHPAAQFCEGLTIGGFSDWYMPAKNELEVCYYNLKPDTGNNNTSSGINPNAVPARASNYTNSPKVPNQTSATDFQSGGTESLTGVDYWSSTQTATEYALRQNLATGEQDPNGTKMQSLHVRAIRRIAV